jgi:hypothetical protein
VSCTCTLFKQVAAEAAAGILLLLQALSARHAIAACMWQHTDADLRNQTATQEQQVENATQRKAARFNPAAKI